MSLVRQSVWNLPTPKRREDTRTFRDEVTGWERTYTLREPDTLTVAEIHDYVEEQWQYWAEVDEHTGKRRAFIVPDPKNGGFEEHRLSRRMVDILCTLERLQVGPETDDFNELLGIAVKLPDV